MHNDLTRRTFLAALSASAAGVLTGGLHRILAAVPEARTDHRRTLGNYASRLIPTCPLQG